MATNHDADFRSFSGQEQTAEPSLNSTAQSSSHFTSHSSTSSQHRNTTTRAHSSPNTSSSSVPQLKKQPSSNLGQVAQSESGSTSPRTSRSTSPVRRESRPQPVATPLSAAAVQRALSASNVPQLQSGPVSEAVSKLPRAQRTAQTSGDTTLQWPVSPRIKSPPPSASSSRRGSAVTQQKKPDATATPNIVVQGSTPANANGPTKQGTPENGKGDQPQQSPQALQPSKPLSRGPSGKSTLETVQENSADSTVEASPAAKRASAELKPFPKVFDDEKQTSPNDKAPGDKASGENEKHGKMGESGSDSGGTREGKRGRTSSHVKTDQTTATGTKATTNKNASYTGLSAGKPRQTEGTRNMTVETETVSSIPQSALNPGDRNGAMRGENSGSVRLKPSNETIRPKKERKKPSQKARSVNQGTDFSEDTTAVAPSVNSSTASSGNEAEPASSAPALQPSRFSSLYATPMRRMLGTLRSASYQQYMSRNAPNQRVRKASSKADIFEARVASAVDEANSSDSDETFVYESNPPETQRRTRHHSRTPSVTSAHSAVNEHRGPGTRGFSENADERKVAGKRSMKFSNNPYNDPDTPGERQDGTARSHQPRHYGRFGRGGSHASMFDPDSPFTQASKLRSGHLNPRHSRPNSPRSPQSISVNSRTPTGGLFNGRKNESSFDFDAEGADDERTPLVGSVRARRSGRAPPSRLNSGSARSIDEYYGVRQHSRCGRFSGCVLGSIVFAVVVISAIVFLVMSNRPMYDTRIDRIQNVLASEQEIMLDLLVGSVNPNALGIAVADMDINVFAKSGRVGGSDGHQKGKRDHDICGGKRESATSASQLRHKERRRLQAEASALDFSPDQSSTADKNPNPWQDLSGHWHSPSASDSRDDGTDPPDLEHDAQTMLLGRIFHFDTSLSFEGSPIKRHLHYSVGELRLAKPGNKTETGGSARWEKVLQEPFELIVRGVLKYGLPISGRELSAAVGASICVHPEDGVDDEGRMRLSVPNHEDDWQWIDWPPEDDEPALLEGEKAGKISAEQ
ncbi:hypothetical protein MBLNU230_g8648t1 [Neophaeotheca triangularis]